MPFNTCQWGWLHNGWPSVQKKQIILFARLKYDSRHPLGKHEIGPSYCPHMPPLQPGQTNTRIFLFRSTFALFSLIFAKNVPSSIMKDKWQAILRSKLRPYWPIISSVYNGNVMFTKKLIKNVLMHFCGTWWERSNISSCDTNTHCQSQDD